MFIFSSAARKIENVKFALSQRGRRLIAIVLGFPLIVLLLAACTGDRFNPNSGWSGVVDGGQDVYVGPHLLEAFLVPHAESVLFVENE